MGDDNHLSAVQVQTDCLADRTLPDGEQGSALR